MPIFDDRFARQNRCEPPPEFPLASPYTGIVHLLSGPAPYALTQIHPRTSGSVDDAPKLSPAFTFITRRGLTPEHSHTKTTPCSAGIPTRSEVNIQKLGFNGVAATITSNEGFTTTLWKLEVTANQFEERELTRVPTPSCA
ncbi:hypothetical protein RAB80_007460 [Fusarium oxysporum f. sp. vasinfectum]|nr:hypothetical protein RAB80_007460 [Fusarium oxysporum f. sp. vasinfectum]